jgi:hypothetical protein
LISAWIASRAGIECFFFSFVFINLFIKQLKNPKTKQTNFVSGFFL